MRLPGRKFLLAGRGGLNLTHSEPLDHFVARYRENAAYIAPFVRAFSPTQLRAWADGLGAETFVGSTGRVFPKAMKASPLLRAWLQRLQALGVAYQGGAQLIDLDAKGAVISVGDNTHRIGASAVVLALGGASWPELGSDGSWQPMLSRAGATLTPLQASNVGVRIAWPERVSALAGQSLKHVAITVGGARFAGEAMLTAYGLEGQVIYAAGAALRAALGAGAAVTLDLQPNREEAALAAMLSRRDPKRTLAAFLQQRCGLSAPSARLIGAADQPRTPDALAASIKRYPLRIEGFASISRAISTAGGVAWECLNADLSLKALPHVFVCGEMLDWDAPTGGYLLQACFSTGVAAGRAAANAKPNQSHRTDPGLL